MSEQQLHTPEPWAVGETGIDDEGDKETVIRAMGGRAGPAVCIDFGKNNPDMREANARRIVAAVNAAKGISTEVLETLAVKPSLTAMVEEYKQQRDTAWRELREIREAIKANSEESTVDEVRRFVAQRNELLSALHLVLDQVDYTRGACGLTEMVGACLPALVIDKAHRAIAKASAK